MSIEETVVNAVQAQEVVEVVEEKVAEAIKPAIINLTTEEKLACREIELEFLKAQMELQRLQKVAETQQEAYKKHIEGLLVKYTLSKTEYIFDGAITAFKKL